MRRLPSPLSVSTSWRPPVMLSRSMYSVGARKKSNGNGQWVYWKKEENEKEEEV